ncbi:hypothetical protein [Streptomyces tubercidicus]
MITDNTRAGARNAGLMTRQELSDDHPAVHALHLAAFKGQVS